MNIEFLSVTNLSEPAKFVLLSCESSGSDTLFRGGQVGSGEVVYLGLGSNMGDRHDNLKKALDFLSQRLRIEKVSSIYETEPIGNVEQPRFLNLVCRVHTMLPPMALLTLAKGVESKLGRTPGKPNSSRPVDIDILFYGEQVVDTPELVIPHPRLTERAFVLVPLAEIAPDLVHPVNGKTVKELLNGIAEEQGVFKWEGDQRVEGGGECITYQ